MPEINNYDDYTAFEEPGVYVIWNKSSGTVLDLNNGDSTPGTKVQGWTHGGDVNNHQMWQIASVGKGKHLLINRGTGTYVQAVDDNAAVTSQTGFPDDRRAHFKITSDPKEPKLTLFGSMKWQGDVLELKNGASSNGTIVQATGANSERNGQKWLLQKMNL